MSAAVAVVGATGRMGRLAIELIERSDDFEVAAALSSKDSLDALADADLVLDVTVPVVSPTIVDAALTAGKPVLVGTSGWNAERLASLGRRLADLPDLGVIVVPNFSIGSVLATRFATIAGRFFDSVEIIEAHASSKIDSPSGTATRTAELITAARAELGPVAAPHADQRARGQQVASIPVHSMRMNGIVAQQEVVFGGDGEVLRLTHQTISPSSYEAGILAALRALPAARGLTVGLDAVLGLDA
ncbi:4-hydroxy-tetrahydrodipicolinate reductase [Schumannella sp. 10F1B-5-1]|uniref:4-hydroxy-tetrahydrodipicolinate reductase n=1 Tax=Schumannella sp. 10F1B-5-1 TaxID=2590780 RepID=UPI0011320189|nr:4-hydroxy-tetrahydrodipicolinate reductase [Schumannella sp. 10F1B-5-1]TPW70246.1 4-hydroxy-tetrahydrodipicolinate reductase [Schumannella sp. 10F1B-5-1]